MPTTETRHYPGYTMVLDTETVRTYAVVLDPSQVMLDWYIVGDDLTVDYYRGRLDYEMTYGHRPAGCTVVAAELTEAELWDFHEAAKAARRKARGLA